MEGWIKIKQVNYEEIQRQKAIETWGVSCLDGPRTADFSRNQGLVPRLVRKEHRVLSPEQIELAELLKQGEV